MIRGEGKYNADITKYDFYSYYRKNTNFDKLNRKDYSAFLKDLLIAYSEAIVLEALELKIQRIGKIRVQSRKLHLLTKEGKLAKSLQVDWKKTKNYWKEKYPGKSMEEIYQIKNKKVFYFDNAHTNGEFYRHIWDNATAVVKFKRFYKFKPSRQYSRLIAATVTDPERKVFYYG